MRTILGFLAAAAIVGAAAGPRAEPARGSMIVTTAWVAEHLRDRDLVLLHVGERGDYDGAHLPGARFLPREAFGVRDEQSGLTLQVPPVARLVDAFEALGVSNGSRIVLYFGTDWVTPTARAYFTLDYLGLGDRASIMDGGLPAWRAENRPVSREAPTVSRGRLAPNVRPGLVASLADVVASLRASTVALVDSRLPRYYDGTDPGSMPRAGHIPGARSIPYSSLVGPDNRLKDEASLRQLFADAGVPAGRAVITYCHIGQQASLDYFVARYLGYAVRLYDGSFEEWSRHAELAVEPASAR